MGTRMQHTAHSDWHKVLLVEDDAAIAMMFSLALEHDGFAVTVAPDGATAMRAAESHDADVVVLDLTLPGVDGLTVLRSLRQTGFSAATPVIVLSNRTQDFPTAVALGAVQCLFKARTTPAQLCDRIESVCRSHLRGA